LGNILFKILGSAGSAVNGRAFILLFFVCFCWSGGLAVNGPAFIYEFVFGGVWARWEGFEKRLLQQSFVQPAWGEPASWMVPKTINAGESAGSGCTDNSSKALKISTKWIFFMFSAYLYKKM
jgi:hypothetical protein